MFRWSLGALLTGDRCGFGGVTGLLLSLSKGFNKKSQL